MKAMILGFLAIAVIGIGSGFVLERAGFASSDVYSGENVRLD